VLTLLREIPANREKYRELIVLGPQFRQLRRCNKPYLQEMFKPELKTNRDLTGSVFPEPAATETWTVCNPRLRLLVLYLFNRHEFPWVGNWEESYSRTHTPWNGREFCRGFEFSTTPFPIPRRETVAQGKLFDEATYIWLSAKSIIRRRYMIVLLDVPETFKGVAAVYIEHGPVQITERSTQAVFQTHAKDFL
jgi:hypothetical protein